MIVIEMIGGYRENGEFPERGRMKKEIPNPYTDQECFLCGERNSAGLKLKFYVDDESGEVTSDYVPSKPFTGLGNIFHGGIQSALFDEIMGWTAHFHTGQMGVTSELTVQFLRPAYLGQKLIVSCRISSREGSRVRLDATIVTSEGALCARATGTYYLLSKERFENLVNGQA